VKCKNTRLSRSSTSNETNDNNDDDTPRCWNPDLRKTLAAISSLGLLETGYLTLDKLSQGNGLVDAICTGDATGSPTCGDVLHGPYASLHVGGGLDIPLSLLGMVAYAAVLALAAFPLIDGGNDNNNNNNDNDNTVPTIITDAQNRIFLLATTTLMASFSVYLVSLILGVLHATCAFCFASAGCSIALATLTWAGGALPSSDEIAAGDATALVEWRKKGVALSASSVGAATAVALGLFLGADDPDNRDFSFPSSSSSSSSSSGSTLLASAASSSHPKNNNVKNTPPPITTTSTPQALSLAADLSSLDSKMYGAFWCSHCYDQKQSLGSEAMRAIPYVECDRDGYRTQRDLCRAKDVPGYPTWEIGGELFPGERSVDELREIVDGVLAKRK